MAALQGQEIPLGALLGGQPGLLGGAFAGLLLLGGLWLWFTRAVDWRIPLGMILALWIGGGFLTMLYPEAFGESWLSHLLSGGFLLAAFWLAADPVTSPMTPRGKWLFAVAIALLIVVLRGLTPWPEEAIVFAVLMMNALVPWLDRITTPRAFGAPPSSQGGKG
jgi:electron transport complex protein RnfD